MIHKLNTLPPGSVLMKDYIKPMGLTQNGLARSLAVAPRRINEIVRGTRAITLDTSIRLGRLFHQSPTFWLHMQTECDLRKAKLLLKKVSREVRPMQMTKA